jgi:integrase
VRYLTAEEEQRLNAAIEPTHPERWAAVLFALNTGLRAGEQWSLTPNDLSLNSVQPQVTLSETKNGTVRHVPLNQYARASLDVLKKLGGNRTRVFVQQSYRGWFEIALTKAGIANFTWHCLRHTFASRLVMAGVDLRTVAELMGHKSLQMTMRYAHMAPEHKAAAVDKLVARATDTKTDTEAKVAPSTSIATIEQPQLLQAVA